MKTVLLGCVISALAVLLLNAPQTAQEQPEPQQVLLIAQQVTQDDSLAAQQPEEENTALYSSDDAQLRLLCDGEVVSLSVREYLAAVVLCEMPVSFAPEALKAQAVAARTFLWKQSAAQKHAQADVCADSACCQAWKSEQALREQFAQQYDEALEKAMQAVCQTSDEVLCYEDKLIDATYFSCSGGSTEAAEAVWGTDVPYLQAVESPGEEYAARYESTLCISTQAFREAILKQASGAVFPDETRDWVQALEYTDGGGVASAVIGGVSFSGTQLRSLFGLNSTKFTLELTDDTAVFHVLGYGHRVGMSQYGADNLAANGFSYRVILQYYYRDTRLKKLSRDDSGQYSVSKTSF